MAAAHQLGIYSGHSAFFRGAAGVGHGSLDLLGMIPGLGEAADLTNAGLYALQGDYSNAILGAAAAVPFLGYAATAYKYTKRSRIAKLGGSRNINPLGGTTNCAGCSIAGDATLKGIPASALNHVPILTSDISDYFRKKSWKTGLTKQRIINKMDVLGSGSTGIVYGNRGGGKVGHFFNVTNKNGVVEFLDFQKQGSAVMKASDFQRGYQDFWFINTTGFKHNALGLNE